ncbi:MAG: SH3 domain-containing protein [Anaerolineae bacterium]|nr:SH3 domain-containing protein [Anaerolineae bacterium]
MTILILLSLMIGSMTSASELEQRATFEAPLLVVNTSFLNVRTGPGVQYSTLVTVVGGSELPVLGVAGDQVWYQVATDVGPGWVNVNFTLARGDFSNVPFVEVGDLGASNADLGQGGGATVPGVSTGSVQTTRSFDIERVSNRIAVTGVTSIGRNIHQDPSYSSLILSRHAPNDPNLIYPLIDALTNSEATWYKFNIPSIGVGWVDAVGFRPLECGLDQVGVVLAAVPINFDGIANREPFLLTPGTEVYIIGRDANFAIVQLLDGTAGFVQADVIDNRSDDVVSACDQVPGLETATGTPVISQNFGQGGGAVDSNNGVRFTVPQLSGNHVVVNTGNLNIRSGPAAGFSVVATVAGGTELIVLGRATDNVWYLIQGDFGQGWINSEFTLFRGTYSTVPVIREPVIIDNSGVAVNIGQGGGVAATTSGITTAGTAQTQTSFDTTRIGNRILITGVLSIGRNMHEQPSYDSLILSRSVPNDPNTVYPLIDALVDSQGTTWYRINIPNIGVGWVDGVVFRPLECGLDQVGVVLSGVPINFDGIANREPFLLTPGTEVYIIGREGDFAIVQLLDGTAGFVQASAIDNRSDDVVSACDQIPGVQTATGTPIITRNTNTPVDFGTGTAADGSSVLAGLPPVTGNRVVINTGNLNIRSGPAAGFGVVATVAGGTELAVVGRAPDGVWYLVEGTFGRGWLNNEFVLFRGDFGTLPVIDFSGN